MAKSNIYFNEVAATVNLVGSIDLSNIYDITLENLDDTDSIKLAWDESTSTATEFGTLVKATSIDFVESGKGGTLYYTANSGTATLRISGIRK
jgi:hypothetical protein